VGAVREPISRRPTRGRRRAPDLLLIAGVCLAIPGRVVSIVDDANRLAEVEIAGVRRTVNVGLLDGETGGAAEGDWVLVHVGFAMSKLDEIEARSTLALLEGLGRAYQTELEEIRGSAIR